MKETKTKSYQTIIESVIKASSIKYAVYHTIPPHISCLPTILRQHPVTLDYQRSTVRQTAQTNDWCEQRVQPVSYVGQTLK